MNEGITPLGNLLRGVADLVDEQPAPGILFERGLYLVARFVQDSPDHRQAVCVLEAAAEAIKYARQSLGAPERPSPARAVR